MSIIGPSSHMVSHMDVEIGKWMLRVAYAFEFADNNLYRHCHLHFGIMQ